MRKWKLRAFLALLVLAAGTLFGLRLIPGGAEDAFVPARSGGRTLVLDAGHGGEDGGAVSPSGAVESGLNLAIVLRLDQLLGLYGEAPVLLRSGDVSLHDESAGTLREKKVSDLHNRADLVNAIPGAVLLSIHQNSLPSSPATRGAQTFWNGQAEAKELAESVQAALNAAVNGEHEKQAAQVPSSVYLMKSVEAPAVLVECGFLSNPEETALLKEPAHQTRLAAAITAGLIFQIGVRR